VIAKVRAEVIALFGSSAGLEIVEGERGGGWRILVQIARYVDAFRGSRIGGEVGRTLRMEKSRPE
jgi:hypothetical protein